MVRLRLNTLKDICFLVMDVLAYIGVLGGFLNIENSGFRLSFVPLVAVFIIGMFQNRRVTKKVLAARVIIIVMLIWASVISAFFEGDDTPLNLYAFVGILMLYNSVANWKISRTTLRIFLLTGIMASIVFALTYTSSSIEYVGMGMTIGNFNPQHVGIWAFVFLCICLIAFDTANITAVHIFLLFLMLFMTKIIFDSETRTAQVALAFLLILWLFPIPKSFKKKYVQVFLAALPLFVALTSIILYLGGLGRNEIGRSLLNGRESLWIRYFEESLLHPLVGAFSKYYSAYTHNIFMQHLMLYGYLGAFIFVILTYKAINLQSMYIQNQISYDCMICFSAFLLAASQEDMIFSTACGGVFIVVCSFLILVNNNENCPLQGDVIHESIKKLYGTRKRGWSFGKRYHNDA